MQIQLLSLTGQGSVSELASPPSADNSICKTLVETYGYACEEHTTLLSSVTIQSRRSDVYPKFFFLTDGISIGCRQQQKMDSFLAHREFQRGGTLRKKPTVLGTLIVLAALSKDQSLKMLRSAALFSPTAYLGQITSPVAKVSADIVTVNVNAKIIYVDY
ncbi:hypothetical protein D5086_026867 [Populus alba]|uniref:Uncharacterized protein n=1 Tax=Populus alba TaxID=43335 RepID=A0ACC4B324_POPAL